MSQEFATILDLVLKKGFTYPDVLAHARQVLKNELKRQYPNIPDPANILINEQTGEARFYSQDNQDITPPEFVHESASVTRQSLLYFLQQHTESTANPSTFTLVQILKSRIPLFPFLFWGYNILYSVYAVFISVLAIFQLVSSNQWQEIAESITTFQLLNLLVLILTPPVVFIFAAVRKLKKQDLGLKRLFFVCEIPLITLAIIFGSIQANPTPFVYWLIIMLYTTPIFAYTYKHISWLKKNILQLLVFAYSSWLALTLGYLSLLMAFVLPLLVVGPASSFIKNVRIESVVVNITEVIILGLVFVAFLVVFFASVAMLVSPFIFVYLSLINIYNQFHNLKNNWSKNLLIQVLCLSIASWLILFIITSYQRPPHPSIDKLSQIKQTDDFETQAQLVIQIQNDQTSLKKYLDFHTKQSRRYLWRDKEKWLAQMYKDIFKVNDSQASLIQDMFYTAAYPLVYRDQGLDHDQLSSAYNYVFGTDYEYKTNYQNIILASRIVKATTEKDQPTASVVVTDTLKNPFNTNEEVIYEFSLPPGSVIQNLRLGKDLEYTGQVAPRGAAQLTYQAQIRVRIDPALLEQVGPQQYRLRVYPVPPKNRSESGIQKVEFSYITVKTNQGIGLPIYSRQSNLKIDSPTQISLNDQNLDTSHDSKWINQPTELVSICNLSGKNFTHGNTYFQSQLSIAPDCGAGNNLQNLNGKHIGIFVDIRPSKKSTAYTDQLNKTISNHPELLNTSKVTLYFYNDKLSQPVSLDQSSIDLIKDYPMFGQGKQFEGLKQTAKSFINSFDAIIILAQPHGDIDPLFTPTLSSYSPVYLVYPEGNIPGFSQKLTENMLASNYQTSSSLETALSMFDQYLSTSSDPNVFISSHTSDWTTKLMAQNVANEAEQIDKSSREYLLQLINRSEPSLQNFNVDKNDQFSYISAKSLVDYLIFDINKPLRLPATSDNRLKNYRIEDVYEFSSSQAPMVNLYTSLIALINDQQQRQLENFSYDDDRFSEQLMVTAPTTGTREVQSIQPFFGNTTFGGNRYLNALQLPSAANQNVTFNQELSASSAFGARQFNLISLVSGGPILMFNFILLGMAGIVYLLSRIRKRRSK